MSAGNGLPDFGELEPLVQTLRSDHGVEAVQLAIVRKDAIAYSNAWGCRETTAFQAASISKPVAALAALRVGCSPTAEVNDLLRSWRLPGHPVTVRELLAHAGGITVSGLPGYAAEPPTLRDVLAGRGATPAVQATLPRGQFAYSGGGYAVLQLLLEDVAGERFASIMERLVFAPAGMRHSVYVRPADSADGHDVEGALVVHAYPELAAAGLWTTAIDLARFLVETGKAPAAFFEPVAGLRAPAGVVQERWFYHGGANAGYRAFIVRWHDASQGAAVMTNSDRGAGLIDELLTRALPGYEPP